MPLSKKKGIHGNIREVMDSWHRTRKIGNIHTKSAKKASQIAAAIAYKESRKKS